MGPGKKFFDETVDAEISGHLDAGEWVLIQLVDTYILNRGRYYLSEDGGKTWRHCPLMNIPFEDFQIYGWIKDSRNRGNPERWLKDDELWKYLL